MSYLPSYTLLVDSPEEGNLMGIAGGLLVTPYTYSITGFHICTGMGYRNYGRKAVGWARYRLRCPARGR